GLHDSAEPVAPHRPAPSGRGGAGAEACACAWAVASGNREPDRERAPLGRAHARRPDLDAGDARAVDARVPRRARRVAAVVRALRVLMVSDVSPLSGGGGGERVLWEHARGLAGRGHAVTVLARAPNSAAAGTFEREGVRVVLFGAGRRTTMGFLCNAVFAARRAARELLAGSEFDALDVHQPLAGWGVMGLPAARRLPVLYTFLSPAPLEYRSRERMTRLHIGGIAGRLGAVALWAIERMCLRRAARIQVLSGYSAEQLWQLYGIAED